MFSSSRFAFVATAIVALANSRLGNAQATPVADSVFARARRLVAAGNGAAGRVLVDSMLAAAPPESPAYADALYWHGALAASPGDAERDYRRLVVDYWYAPRAADALLQLAQIETNRGDRAAASSHLQRFMNEAPTHPDRPRVGLTLTRLLFDQNDIPHGCVAWRQAMNATPASEVELRNQLAYYAGRCTATDVSANSRVPVAYPPGVQPPPALPKDTAARRDTIAASTRGNFTLQLAAFNKKTEATRLVGRLLTRGITARIVGKSKPFRVRVGRYETRAAAVVAQRDLKAKKLDAMVVEIGPDDK